MKKIFTILKIAGLCLGVMLIAACPAAFDPPAIGGGTGGETVSAGMGQVNFSVAGTGARSVFPDNWKTFTYTVTATATEKEPVSGTLTGGSGSLMLAAEVEWDITLTAKAGETEVGKADLGKVTLTEGQTKDFPNVLLTPITGGANGTVSYTITFPAGASGKLFIDSDATGIDLTASPVSVNAATYAAGSHRFRVVLTKGELNAGKATAVHVYPGLTSSFEWEFTDADFTATKDVTVSVHLTLGASVSLAAQNALELTTDDYGTYTNAIVNVNGDVTTATFTIPEVEPEVVTIDGLSLAIKTANNALPAIAVGDKTIGGGENSITLTGVSIYGVTLTRNTGGTLTAAAAGYDFTGKTGINVQVDVFSGTSVTVTAKPSTSDYLFDEEDGFIVTPSATVSDGEERSKNATFIVNENVSVDVKYVTTATDFTLTLANDLSADIAMTLAGGEPVTTSAQVLADAVITFTATPNIGYKLTNKTPVARDSLNSIVDVTFTPDGVTPRKWTFAMPSADITVSMEYPELTTLEIYKGGLNSGVEIVDNIFEWQYFANTVDKIDPAYELDGGGHNGNIRVMMIERPEGGGRDNTGAGAGGQIGEYGFELHLKSEAVLALKANNVTALSFWVKGSKEKNNAFPVVGLGDTNGNASLRKQALLKTGGNFSSPITTGWTQYIVPVPPMKEETEINRVFFIKFDLDNDHQVYLDDIEFLTVTDITLDSIAIPLNRSEVLPTAAEFDPNIYLQGQVNLAYTQIGNVTATLYDGTNQGDLRNIFANWFDAVYAVDGNATMNGNNVVPDGLGANFNLYMSIGEKTSNAMAFSVSSSFMVMIGGFEEDANVDNDGFGYWQAFGWPEHGTNSHSETYCGIYKFTTQGAGWNAQRDPPIAGRNISSISLDGTTTLSFWIRDAWENTTNETSIQLRNKTFTFSLASDILSNEGGNYVDRSIARDWKSVEFTMNNDGVGEKVNGYTEIRIPLSNFTSQGVDITNITGWAVSFTDTFDGMGNGEYAIWLDTIRAE